MSRSSKLGAVLYNTETTFGEVATTFGTRLQTIGPVDVSGLQQQMLMADRTVQLRNEITPGVRGVFGGSFKTRFYLTGHGSTAAGAITLNALETLLGIVIGNVAAAGSNTTSSGTGSASAPGVAAANGTTAGALARFGAIGDARGNGQFAAVSTHTTSVMTLLTALDANMSNGDVVYNPANIYPTEDPTASNLVTGTRWLLQGPNLQYEAHGCYPKALTLSGLNTAEEPSGEIDWGVSWFRPVATPTFPSATSVQTFDHAPVSNGSFFLANHGTATRTKEAIRSFSIAIKLGIVELRGPEAPFERSVIRGCARTPDEVSGEFVIDSEDATATPRLAAKWEANTTPLHILYTWSAADGTAGGLYLPRVYPSDEKPTQFDMDGLNRVRFKFRAGADNTKSSALERAAYRIASA